VVPWFRSAAAQLLQEVGDPEEALAMALARVTGFSAVRVRPRAQLPCPSNFLLLLVVCACGVVICALCCPCSVLAAQCLEFEFCAD
jgi:hypothetical protein